MAYTAVSSDVSIGDIILASDHNDLRDDTLDHDHDGVDFAKVDLTAPPVIGGTTPNDAYFSELGVGTTSPITQIHSLSDGTAGYITSESFSSVATGFIGRLAGGSQAVPAALGLNDIILDLLAQGYDGSGYNSAGRLMIRAREAWSSGNEGTYLSLLLTDNGGTSASNVLNFNTDSHDIDPSGALGTYYARDGDATLQKCIALTVQTRDAAGTGVTYTFTGLTKITHILAFYAEEVEDNITTGLLTTNASYALNTQEVWISNVDSTPSARYNDNDLMGYSFEFDVTSVSGNVVTGDWATPSSGEEAEFALLAFGY